jgi:hypothetical protein
MAPADRPGTDEQRAYIDMLAPGAIRGQEICGVFASVHMAVSIDETGWGESLCGGGNYYGIKGAYWGSSTYADTSECYDGETFQNVLDAQFCAYSSFEESQNHFVNKMRSQYWASVRYASTYQEACQGLYDCGYATDPRYPQKLSDIIEGWELWRYDVWPSTSRHEDPGEQEDIILTPCRPGDCGADVEALQGRLDKLGYDIGPCGVDGIYGQATRKAIEAFQKDHGLTVDGVVGVETIKAMELEG